MDEVSYHKLVEENHNLIYRFLSKYNLSVEDYYDLAAIGFCSAARSFDFEKGIQFSTYSFTCMLNEVRKVIIHSGTHGQKDAITVSLETAFEDSDSTFEDFIGVEDANISYLDFLVDLERFLTNSGLSKKELLIIYYLVKGYTLQQTAKFLGCTSQNLVYIRKRLYHRFVSGSYLIYNNRSLDKDGIYIVSKIMDLLKRK